jgi:hypothetical protein
MTVIQLNLNKIKRRTFLTFVLLLFITGLIFNPLYSCEKTPQKKKLACNNVPTLMF